MSNVAVTSVLPLRSRDDRIRFLIEDGPVMPPNERFQADLRRISSDYFRTLGIELKRGREFTAYDRAISQAPAVAIVDETLVHRYFPAGDPIGRKLLFNQIRFEIMGVAGNVLHDGARRELRPTIYLSYLQRPTERMNLVVRSTVNLADLTGRLKRAIWDLDKDLPLYEVETLEQIVDHASSAPRLTLKLLGLFAAIALGLSSLGVYGLIRYAIGQRTKEIGIKMTLGADSAIILRDILRESLSPVFLGLVIGLLLVGLFSRLMESLLYQTKALDVSVLGGALTLLVIAALAASLLPAWRASKVDPWSVLRQD